MTLLGEVSRNKCSREEAQEVKRGPKKKEEALLAGSGWEKGEGRGDRREGEVERGGEGSGEMRLAVGVGPKLLSPECGSRQRSRKWDWTVAPKGHSHPERHCL